jgi:O-acetyl-ADP-ribose deacetylase (regulator of RNase III)
VADITEVVISGTRLRLLQGDITLEQVDAIVNAANSGLMGGGGVDGDIHRAGGPAILKECKRIVRERDRLPAGQAVLTTGGLLPARHVVHTVGPVWHGGRSGEAETLASAYRESLSVAVREGLRTVSFPSISTGAYGYPLDLAARVALRAVLSFLESGAPLEEVRFVLFDRRTYEAYTDALDEVAGEKGLAA